MFVQNFIMAASHLLNPYLVYTIERSTNAICKMLIMNFVVFISEKIRDMTRLKQELREKGCVVPPDKPAGEHFDSNCITPVRFIIVEYVTFIRKKLYIVQ